MPIIPLAGTASSKGSLVPLGSVRLTSPSGNIIFTSIPAIYQDLVLVLNARVTNSSAISNIYCSLGNTNTPDLGNNYSFTFYQGNQSTVASGRFSNIGGGNLGLVPGYATAPDNFGSSITYFFNYASTTTNKSFLTLNANNRIGAGTIDNRIGLWRNLGAIGYIQLGSDGTYDTGSTGTLYGVRGIGQ